MNDVIRLACGYDHREAAGFSVFASSVIRRATKPVSITPLASMGLPMGSNTFTLSRFLVPALMGFTGRAIFCDASDMLCLGDISELDSLFDGDKAVQVVKHADYDSQHARKYVGTAMECAQSNYSRKNWASVMLMNCAHPAWRGISHQQLAGRPKLHFLQFQNLLDSEIGELPTEWNVLVDEGQDTGGAKVLHWTAGLPSFKHYKNARRSQDWFKELDSAMEGKQDG